MADDSETLADMFQISVAAAQMAGHLSLAAKSAGILNTGQKSAIAAHLKALAMCFERRGNDAAAADFLAASNTLLQP